MNAPQSVNIVMIEDDEGHARLIEKNIRRAGIMNPIRHFTDGTTALDYIFNDTTGPQLNGPALVLLDLNLPDMSGTDILAKIKTSDGPVKRTPVVVHQRRQPRDSALLRSWRECLHYQARGLRQFCQCHPAVGPVLFRHADPLMSRGDNVADHPLR